MKKWRKPLQAYFDDDLEDIDKYINGSDYPNPNGNATNNVDQQTLFHSDEMMTDPLSNTL